MAASQPNYKRGKGGRHLKGLDLSRCQIFACLHRDAKSGIPHLHILINRIDLDGNLINDSFIGNKLMKAVHAINIENAWSYLKISRKRILQKSARPVTQFLRIWTRSLGGSMLNDSIRLAIKSS